MVSMNVTQQMLAFQKQAGNHFQSMWNLAQAQTSNTKNQRRKIKENLNGSEKFHSSMEQVDWLPGESPTAYGNCVEACKSGRSPFKAFIDEGCQQSKKLFK